MEFEDELLKLFETTRRKKLITEGFFFQIEHRMGEMIAKVCRYAKN